MSKRLLWLIGGLIAFATSFGLGMAAVVFEFYPSKVVKDAGTAFVAVQQAIYADTVAEFDMPTVDSPARTARQFEGEANDELILISGGPGYLTNLNPTGCMAWVMDRQGDVKHFWKYDPNLWADVKNISRVPGISQWRIIGVHLFPSGDLLANFQCWQCFPYSTGIARFDRETKLVWKHECLSHHWFSVDETGRIYVPKGVPIAPPLKIGKTQARVSYGESVCSDSVLILDEQGNTLDEISMLEAVAGSGWAGLIWNGKEDVISPDVAISDPLHLNDVRVATRADAGRAPWLNAGDLLVSFRNINAIGVLDIQTRKFKWMAGGCFVRQHSPRFYEDGVLVFDNLGGAAEWGGSQLVKVDFERGLPERIFPITGESVPSRFESHCAGHIDINDDGRRALVTLSYQGQVLEVDLKTGKVLWEYVLARPDGSRDGRGKTQLIHTAKYVHPGEFPFREGPGSRDQSPGVFLDRTTANGQMTNDQ